MINALMYDFEIMKTRSRTPAGGRRRPAEAAGRRRRRTADLSKILGALKGRKKLFSARVGPRIHGGVLDYEGLENFLRFN